MTEVSKVQEELKKLFDIVKLCYQCGTCAGGCPVFRVYPEFNPRKIMETLLFGDSEQLLNQKQIWYCSMCYTCSVRCPQGIDVAHVLTELKNLSAKFKDIPAGILAEVEAIIKTGTTAVISQSILKKRKRLELPKLPPTDINEIKKLLKMTGAVERINQIAKAKEDANQ